MSCEIEILKAFEQNEASLLKDLTILASTIASRMRLPPHLEPCDVAQEVLIVLLESLRNGKFRGDSDIKTFAYRVTVNICLYRNRELRRFESAEQDPDSAQSRQPGPEQLLMDKEKRFLAFRVLRRLPEKCREIFRLIFNERKNYQAIAQLHGVKEVTIRERMSRCRKRARELAEQLSK